MVVGPDVTMLIRSLLSIIKPFWIFIRIKDGSLLVLIIPTQHSQHMHYLSKTW
jgi:hypothetical protein